MNKNKIKCKILDDEVDLMCYSADSSDIEKTPKLVVIPEKTEDVSCAVEFACENDLQIIARGSGTSLCGQPFADIVLDMSRMNKILWLKDSVCVEAGVIPFELNKYLNKFNLFFPPDPSTHKQCTIGGMIANNASGIHSVKYGTTKDYVLGLEVVLADGSVIKTGTESLKSSAGYNITQLFCRSEGTLGIITKAILRVLPKPGKKVEAVAKFKTIEAAGQGIVDIKNIVIPSAMELLDDVACKAVGADCNAMILIETDGSGAEEDMKKISKIVKLNYDEGASYWDGRRNMVPALSKFSETGKAVLIAEDVGVPIRKIPEAIRGIKEIFAKHGLKATIYGHAGDGNLHPKVLCEAKDADTVEKEIYEFILGLGGTITAEHGIGLARKPYLSLEAKESLEVMKKIKNVLDPEGRFPNFL